MINFGDWLKTFVSLFETQRFASSIIRDSTALIADSCLNCLF
jgi:hypothetical protein